MRTWAEIEEEINRWNARWLALSHKERLGLLADPDARIRFRTFLLLDYVGDPESYEAVRDMLVRETDVFTQATLYPFLARVEGDRTWLSYLERSERDDSVLFSIMENAGRRRRDVPRGIVKELLASPSPFVAFATLKYLAKFNELPDDWRTIVASIRSRVHSVEFKPLVPPYFINDRKVFLRRLYRFSYNCSKLEKA